VVLYRSEGAIDSTEKFPPGNEPAADREGVGHPGRPGKERTSNMATGTVKWFSSEKGYGFISQEGGPDVFVHYKAIQGQGYRTLEENEPVEFEVQESSKGLQAVNVVRMAMRAE
jgi:CspA family cold shock protein